MDPSALLAARTRETTIRRDDSGRWSEDGVPIEHPGVISAFNRWLTVAPDGRYCLRNEVNWAYVHIDGPPFFVESLRLEAPGATLRLSGGDEEPLVPESLRQDTAGRLYCDVSSGALTARFSRHAMQQIGAVLGEDSQGLYLELGGQRFRPPIVKEPVRLRAPDPR